MTELVPDHAAVALPDAVTADGAADALSEPEAAGPPRRRSLLGRLGIAALGLLMGWVFGAVGMAAFAGDQPVVGVAGIAGCLMVLWAGGRTLFRG